MKAQLAVKGIKDPHYRSCAWYNIYKRFFNKEIPTEEDWRRLIARYWGLVSQVDTAIGKILDTLRKCGLEKNTIVVFTSDHGDMMGSHRLVTKGFQFEEAVRVPLIIKIPGHPKSGSVITEPISQVDLVPTLLDLMGKPVPEGLDGYSLKSFIDGEGEIPEKNVFIEWFPESMLFKGRSDEIVHPVITIITPEGWKYNWSSFGQHELYNLNEDPLETNNLIKNESYSPLVKRLQKEIERWKTRTYYVVHQHTVHLRHAYGSL
ncbi:sulfatase-like hydrolase/transferase [Candidatus Bathyarchaeota archaeon]|nr:sulfatase-like hydrolase/transferase [Candidatus Bathyarchaeota archaeon]